MVILNFCGAKVLLFFDICKCLSKTNFLYILRIYIQFIDET